MAPPQTPGPTQAFPLAAVSVHGAVYNPVAPVVPPGQQCATQCDSGGNTLVSVVNSVVPGNVGSQTTTITNSMTKTAIVSISGGSPPAGNYLHITGLQITNQSATAVTVTLNDGAMNRKIYDIAANGSASWSLSIGDYSSLPPPTSGTQLCL